MNTYAALARMRESRPELWTPLYDPDETLTLRRIDDIVTTLGTVENVPHLDAADHAGTTVDRIRLSFEHFRDPSRMEVACGFAFVVPGRLSRIENEFTAESDEVFPLFSVLDAPTRQIVWSGMCPTVLDHYGPAGSGERGLIIVNPISSDMTADLGLADAIRTVRRTVSDCLAFVSRLGCSVAGLGALLPKLTGYGSRVSTHGVALTSGHAGTVWLIAETLSAIGPSETLGVVGAGSIGGAAAAMHLAKSNTARVVLYDVAPGACERAAKLLAQEFRADRIAIADDLSTLFTGCQVVVAAATGTVDLEAVLPSDQSLEGVMIIDDSQPSCFDPNQVALRGGALTWVVGRDDSAAGTATRQGFWGSLFTYNGTGPASPSELWGCEAETHAIWTANQLQSIVARPVTPVDVERVGALCEAAGTRVATPQALGVYNHRRPPVSAHVQRDTLHFHDAGL